MMKDFDEDPLDLLDDDGDGVIEMCLFFDEDNKTSKVEKGHLVTVELCCKKNNSTGREASGYFNGSHSELAMAQYEK